MTTCFCALAALSVGWFFVPSLVARSSRSRPGGRSDRPPHLIGRGIRLGRISYVNMAPVFYRLEAEVEEIQGVPTDLNRRLVAGEIDLAPISSIEYARNAATLRILPRLCVSSEGAVDSIQLVSRVPLERIRTVAVTPESATSVVLTKVLLPDADHVPLGEEAEATLLIGDAALKSAFEDPTPHYDLGRLWLERTGLPMVFAVWAAPDPPAPGTAELEDALVESVRLARAEPEQLAYEASERYGYPPGFLARYFEKLRYRFGPRERAGLYTFLEMAHEVGELDRDPRAPLRPRGAGAGVTARPQLLDVADRALPGRAAGGRAQGGPAADGHRVHGRGAQRQPRRRGQAQVVLHLLLRPAAAREARRGGDAPAAGGDRAHRRAVRPAPHDRLGARQPRLAVPRRAGRGRRAPAGGRRARRSPT